MHSDTWGLIAFSGTKVSGVHLTLGSEEAVLVSFPLLSLWKMGLEMDSCVKNGEKMLWNWLYTFVNLKTIIILVGVGRCYLVSIAETTHTKALPLAHAHNFIFRMA